MAVPQWFEMQTYFDNKLASLRASEPDAQWDAAKLRSTFEGAGYEISPDGLYRHFQDWGNSPQENISPNRMFDVSHYMASKYVQMLQADPSYTLGQLYQAFSDANLSAWHHYSQYGFAEKINPSAGFNTAEYMNAKLAEMQKTEPWYTMEALEAAFLAAGVNPVEHYTQWGKDEGLSYTPRLPGEVPDIPGTTPDTPAQPGDSPDYILPEIPGHNPGDNPGATTPPADPTPDTPKPNQFTTGNDVINDNGAAQSWTALVKGDESTLNPGDQITAGNENTSLNVDLQDDFAGFADSGFMTGVKTVNITDAGGHTFNAQGVTGATSYSLFSATGESSTLANLDGDVERIGLNNYRHGVTLGFGEDAPENLTLALHNVQMESLSDSGQYVDGEIIVGNVPNLTIAATTDENSPESVVTGIKDDALTDLSIVASTTTTIDIHSSNLKAINAVSST